MDDDVENGSSINYKVYLNAASVFALFLADIVLFIILEIVWIDSVCSRDMSDGGPITNSLPSTKTSTSSLVSAAVVNSTTVGLSSTSSIAPTETGEVVSWDHHVRWGMVGLNIFVTVMYLCKVYTVIIKTRRVTNSKITSSPFHALWFLLLVVIVYAVVVTVEVFECATSEQSFWAEDNVQSLQRAKVLLLSFMRGHM